MSQDPLIQKAVRAALKLAETQPWQHVTLAQIADATGQKLADFQFVMTGRDLAEEVDPLLDAAMSEGSLDPDETPRTRLFDVIMMRFEAMEDTRDGVMSFLRWRDGSLTGLSLRVRQRYATARWAMMCAGLDGASPVPQNVQILAIGYAIAAAERAWRQETSADLNRTMARLDAELLKLEQRAKWLKGERSVQNSQNG